MKPRFTAPPFPLAPSRLHLHLDDAASVEDAVSRGKRLAADPNYPNLEICQRVADALLASSPAEKTRPGVRGWVGARG